jgi:hypothetical protein
VRNSVPEGGEKRGPKLVGAMARHVAYNIYTLKTYYIYLSDNYTMKSCVYDIRLIHKRKLF